MHVGEVEVHGRYVTGLAVHTAARVMSSAAAGGMLASRALRDLVAGSGFRMTDRGKHALKGVPGMWQLYSVDCAAHAA